MPDPYTLGSMYLYFYAISMGISYIIQRVDTTNFIFMRRVYF